MVMAMLIMNRVMTQFTWLALASKVAISSATARFSALLLRLTVKVPNNTLTSTQAPPAWAFDDSSQDSSAPREAGTLVSVLVGRAWNMNRLTVLESGNAEGQEHATMQKQMQFIIK